MGDKESWEGKVRRIEALFRFGAALPARDGFDEALYREWGASRDRTSARPIYGCFPQLRTLTARDLRLLAEANVRAQAEDAAKLREKEHKREPEQEPKAEAEAEASF
jgi:hypothetical protein